MLMFMPIEDDNNNDDEEDDENNTLEENEALDDDDARVDVTVEVIVAECTRAGAGQHTADVATTATAELATTATNMTRPTRKVPRFSQAQHTPIQTGGSLTKANAKNSKQIGAMYVSENELLGEDVKKYLPPITT
jgi:hypothetical protein